MCLENKRIIILRFVLFFGVMLLVLGCAGIGDDDPNARYIGVVSEGDCAKKGGYWYNNECWSNVTDDDGSLTADEVDAHVDRYLQAKSRAEVRINGKAYKPFAFDMLPQESGIESMSIRYLQNDTIFNIMFYLDAQAWSMLEQGKETKVDVELVVGDVYGDSNDSPSTIAEGQVYVAMTENNEHDDIAFTLKGMIERTDVSGVEDIFNVYASIDLSFIGGGDSTLSIEGDKAYLNGMLGAEAHVLIRGLQKHPEVKTLVLQRVLGAFDSMTSMHTARLVRTLGLITYLPSDGVAYSSGVDLFAGGVERIVERGGKLGIHAWCCGADELVDTHPLHRPYIEHLTNLMGEKLGQSFYFRTIKAAPADGMYIMTEDEMIQSGIATKIIDPFMSQ